MFLTHFFAEMGDVRMKSRCYNQPTKLNEREEKNMRKLCKMTKMTRAVLRLLSH